MTTRKKKVCLDGTENSKRVPRLVQTDYDNFKNLKFFQTQYLKAQEMLREVNDFNQSFLKSKLLSVDEVIADDYNWLLFQPGIRMFNSTSAYIATLADNHFFVSDYIKNNKSKKSQKEIINYLSENIDLSEKTFREYTERFIEAYKSGSPYLWSSLEKERPVYNNKSGWDRKVIGYYNYNPFGDFKKRFWDVYLSSCIITWIEHSFYGGGREYGDYIYNLSSLCSTIEETIKDVYRIRPNLTIEDGRLKYHFGEVDQDLAISRLRKEHHDLLETIHERISKYGIRVPNQSYAVMLMGDDRGRAFKDYNLIYNPHKVKCVVDRKKSQLVPFMDERSTVDIKIKGDVLRCTSVTKNRTEDIRYSKSYEPHYVHKVTIDFDMNTNELLNTREETISNKDMIWRENV